MLPSYTDDVIRRVCAVVIVVESNGITYLNGLGGRTCIRFSYSFHTPNFHTIDSHYDKCHIIISLFSI